MTLQCRADGRPALQAVTETGDSKFWWKRGFTSGGMQRPNEMERERRSPDSSRQQPVPSVCGLRAISLATRGVRVRARMCAATVTAPALGSWSPALCFVSDPAGFWVLVLTICWTAARLGLQDRCAHGPLVTWGMGLWWPYPAARRHLPACTSVGRWVGEYTYTKLFSVEFFLLLLYVDRL